MTHRYIGTKEIVAWPAEKDLLAGPTAGYSVKYADGYTSWSPKEAFEQAYRVREGDNQSLTFGDAIHFLKQGKRVARAGWNGKGMYLGLQRPDGNSKMSLPYIYMKTADNKLVPWLASQTDMLNNDWSVLE